MKFSIITIAKNCSKYLEQTINSVLNQSYENFEYIIIYGESIDSTWDIIQKYKSKVKVIKETGNQGISFAMNLGIQNAVGDVIAHIHADDLYANNNVFDRVAAEFQGAPDLKWLSANKIKIDAKGSEIGKFIYPKYLFKKLLIKNIICHPSTFIRKEVFAELGLFDINYKYAMDYDLFLRIAERYTPKILPDFLSYSRVHSGSVTNANELKSLREARSIQSSYALKNKAVLIYVWLILRFFVKYIWYIFKYKFFFCSY